PEVRARGKRTDRKGRCDDGGVRRHVAEREVPGDLHSVLYRAWDRIPRKIRTAYGKDRTVRGEELDHGRDGILQPGCRGCRREREPPVRVARFPRERKPGDRHPGFGVGDPPAGAQPDAPEVEAAPGHAVEGAARPATEDEDVASWIHDRRGGRVDRPAIHAANAVEEDETELPRSQWSGAFREREGNRT